MHIGRAIRLCRIQQNLSQSQLATLAGLSVSYLSLLEREKRDPALSTVEHIADSLHMPLFLLVFLASPETELESLNIQLREKLSDVALRMLNNASIQTESK